mmetsp:Transcript_10044/g.20661  ORF Transcript_10044/g.20661 Transcript_10044/m.20661 type:complete len:195 (+) Transcript_10044:579-1163(+)
MKRKEAADGVVFGNAPLLNDGTSAYSDAYSLTAGDRLHLGGTSLLLRIESDLTHHGDECKFGGLMTSVSSSLALDCVITNAIVLDATLGVVKADIGIKGNRIHNSGQAGNPDFMNGVTLDPGREMIVGPTTDVIAGEKLIVSAGGGSTPTPSSSVPSNATRPSPAASPRCTGEAPDPAPGRRPPPARPDLPTSK